MSAGKVMVVTGARKGIGRALAEHYVAQGYRVVGCSRGPAEPLDGYRHETLDVADEAAVKRLFESLRREHGRLDALVNNAGLGLMNLALLTPAASVSKILETNVLGAFLFCREAAKLMQPRGAGRIVNLGSAATVLRPEGESIYAASKAALATMSEVLARELGPLGITVNVVAPGPVQTDLMRGVPTEAAERLVARQAIRRWCETRDIANAVDFFLRDESCFVTGQTLYLGGP